MKSQKVILILASIMMFTMSCQQSSTNNSPDNVKNYDITVAPWQWTYDNLYERHYYRYNTTAFESDDAILGYVMSGSGKQALPYYTCPSFMCEQYDMANTLFNGYIEFQFTNYVSKTTEPDSDVYLYLVVVTHKMLEEYPELDLNNYEEVARTFNLGEPTHLTAK